MYTYLDYKKENIFVIEKEEVFEVFTDRSADNREYIIIDDCVVYLDSMKEWSSIG